MTDELDAGIRMRRATASDLASMSRILDSAALAEADLAAQVGTWFVAAAGDEVLGVVALQVFGGDALVRSLCVAQEQRGRGIGGALVEHTLTEAALDAIDNVYLLTNGAERFFARFGFIPIAAVDLPFTVSRAAKQSGGAPEDATPMQLRLVEP